MFRRHLSDPPVSRGQALVEFALVLPVLALLLVLAIDFGRVFFGWVSVTNAARIGANFAGQHPNLLANSGERDDYEVLIGDAVTGCTLTPSDLNSAVYNPTFTDVDGDGKANGWGDHATVNLACEFDLFTPLTEAIFGNKVAMSAEAVFPIRTGSFTGPTGGGGGPPNPVCTLELVPDLVNRTLGRRTPEVDRRGIRRREVQLRARRGRPATGSWLPTRPRSSLHSRSFSSASTRQGSSCTVHAVTPPPCPSGQAQVPDLIGLLVSDAKLAWTNAGFTGAFKPNNAVNTKTVLTQTTSPVTSPVINGCVTVAAEVTITYGDPPAHPCDVPNMISMTKAEAQAAWAGAHFTTTLTSNGPNGGTVDQQTPTHPGTVDCGVPGHVRLHN